MNKLPAAIALALALTGCASVPMGDAKRDAALKTFQVPADKAGIYVYRNESMGAAVKMNVIIDGQNIGETAANTYMYKEVLPGKHSVSSKAENTDTVDVDLKPGALVFIWQEVKMGLMYSRTKLHLVSEQEGKKGVTETKLAIGTSIGTEITSGDNQIQFPHYSLVLPTPDWHLSRPDENNEVALIALQAGPPLLARFQMQFMKNGIFDERVKSWSARQVADDYRNLEKRTMIEQGVKKGQYQLSEVVMGEETVGDKKFYTMKYTTSASSQKQSASLYLYFPRDEGNSWFIVAHYSETMPPNVTLSTSFHPEFLQTLKSLRVNQ